MPQNDTELAVVLKLVADQFKQELKNSQTLLGSFNSFIRDWKTQATAAGAALFAIAKSTAAYGDELAKASQKIGISVQGLSALQYAAGLADLSNEQLAKGLKGLSVNMDEAARRTGDGAQVFERLSISATDAHGQLRPTEEVLLDLADRFAGMSDGAEKSALAIKLFGKSGLDMIPFLNQGRDGIGNLREEARRFGLVMSEEDAKASEAFNDSLKSLQGAARGLTNELGTALMPSMTGIVTVLRDLVAGATAAAEALPKVGRALPSEVGHIEGPGGRGSLVLPPPPGAQKAVVEPFFSRVDLTYTPRLMDEAVEQFRAIQKAQEALGRVLTAIGIREHIEGPTKFKGTGDEMVQMYKDRVKADEDYAKRVIESTKSTAEIEKRIQDGQRDDFIAFLQARVNAGEAELASFSEMAARRHDLLEAGMAKDLGLTVLQTREILEARRKGAYDEADAILATTERTELQRRTIIQKYEPLIDQERRREIGGFLEGWREGLHKYVTDTSSMFSLAVDAARLTALNMQQSFQRFFFDAMTGKIQSLKDVLNSIVLFAQQIVSQVAATAITGNILSVFAGSFVGAGAGTGAGAAVNVPGGFQSGGVFVVPGYGGPDSQRVSFRATPGERVTVETPEQQQGRASAVSIEVQVINSSGSKVSAQPAGQRADGRHIVRVMVEDAMKDAFHSGNLDRTMQLNYGINRRGSG